MGSYRDFVKTSIHRAAHIHDDVLRLFVGIQERKKKALFVFDVAEFFFLFYLRYALVMEAKKKTKKLVTVRLPRTLENPRLSKPLRSPSHRWPHTSNVTQSSEFYCVREFGTEI